MFAYKHTETIEYLKKVAYTRKKQTLRVNNSRIPGNKNAKFSGYYFYMNAISAPLNSNIQHN